MESKHRRHIEATIQDAINLPEGVYEGHLAIDTADHIIEYIREQLVLEQRDSLARMETSATFRRLFGIKEQ